MKRWWVQSVVALGGSIVVTVGTHMLSWTQSWVHSITVVVVTWAIGMVFQIAYSLHSLHVGELRNRYVLEVLDDVDRSLLELQSRFREISTRQLSGRPNRVFLDYCRRSLESSLGVARDAAQRGELEVRDHHFVTIETVLAAFDGCQDRTFRCVWLIEKDEGLFDPYWREYMKSIVALSRRRGKQRVGVRILFVLDNPEQLERRSVQTVVGFVAAERGFECHLMLRTDYESRLVDGRLDTQYEDFGVYGDHLLFRTRSYDPNVGVFSDNRTTIDAYVKMHDAAMGAAPQLEVPAQLPADVSVEKFLDCDDRDEDGRT